MRFVKRQFNHWGKPAISAVLVLLVWLQVALAASEPLHKLFHPDAGQASHECAVTLFSHGQIDSAAVDLPVPLPCAGIEVAPPALVSFYVPVAHALPPGRGPPCSV